VRRARGWIQARREKRRAENGRNVTGQIYPQCDDDHAGEAAQVPAAGIARTPGAILRELRDAPPVVVAGTGIPELDRLCGGGFPIPWRVVIVGMPSAWKTGLAVYLADHFERAGLAVGILAVDEEPEDVVVRVAQMAGCTREKLQHQDPAELEDAIDQLEGSHLYFYTGDTTIEAAAADLAAHAAAANRRAVLIVDSLQTARCEALRGVRKTNISPRDVVEANVAAFRSVTSTHRMIGIATSEANRAAYRDGGVMQAGMAAGAESRSIEYAAQTLILLRADEAQPDTIFHAEVVKNRARLKGAFSFELNREAHTIREVDGHALAAQQKAERRDQKKAKATANQRADAIAVARELLEQPGIGTNALHAALKARHGSFAEPRCTAGLDALGAGVVLLPGPGRAKLHYVNGPELPAYVVEALGPEAATATPPISFPQAA
jgi:KaiC/GvpD/RAD55 family RecA-like ATPase